MPLWQTVQKWLQVYFFTKKSRQVTHFSITIFFHRNWRLTGQDWKGEDHFLLHSYPPTHKHSDIHLQLCMWDGYHIFLIATLVFTRLLLDENLPPYGITIWLIDDVKFVLVSLLDDSILGFCYSNLDTGNRWTRTRSFLLF